MCILFLLYIHKRFGPSVAQLVFAEIAQLGERQTEDLKVLGSIPGRGICYL